jgi:hypothetical protein
MRLPAGLTAVDLLSARQPDRRGDRHQCQSHQP